MLKEGDGIMDKKVYRIIDVNFNRATEGLRVVEDYFRFIKEDKDVSNKIKNIRHKLDRLSLRFYPALIKARDIQKDFLKRKPEHKKKDIKEVIFSNFKRVEQAVRVLEEYSKLISKETGFQMKKMRFSIYSLEKIIVRKYKNE